WACFVDGVRLGPALLCPLVEPPGGCLLPSAFDRFSGRGVTGPRLGRRLVQVLEQFLDGLLVLLVHVAPPAGSAVSRRFEHYPPRAGNPRAPRRRQRHEKSLIISGSAVKGE